MQMRDVPQSEWTGFFHECSARHRGQPVTVEEMAGPYHGIQSDAFELPLVQIVDRRGDAGDRIEVIAGDEARVHHVVESPTHVQVFKEQEEEGVTIVIATSDGRATRLRVGACGEDVQPGQVS